MYVIGMCILIVGELLPSPSKKEDLRGVFGAGLVGRESEMDVTEMRCFKGLEGGEGGGDKLIYGVVAVIAGAVYGLSIRYRKAARGAMPPRA